MLFIDFYKKKKKKIKIHIIYTNSLCVCVSNNYYNHNYAETWKKIIYYYYK